MTRLALLLLLALLGSYAHAEPHDIVGIKCNPRTDRLIIYYTSTDTDTKSPNEWGVSDLIGPGADGSFGELRTISRMCALSHGNYTIWIGPDPDNMNANGECGANVSFWVEIRRGEDWVLTRHRLDSERCNSNNGVTTSRIVIDASSLKPKLTEIPTNAKYSSRPLAPNKSLERTREG
jgi:hypothetical protein